MKPNGCWLTAATVGKDAAEPTSFPTVTDLNGTDPLGIGANVHRRHLSKGQLAMAVARVM